MLGQHHTEFIAGLVLFGTVSATLYGILTGILGVGEVILLSGGLLICGSIYFATISKYKRVTSDLFLVFMFSLGCIFVTFRIAHFPYPVFVTIIVPYEESIRRAASMLLVIWVAVFLVAMEYRILPNINRLVLELRDDDP